jgi:GrpB-like predicted nucleotidyltransferase (UPF0157 family)
VDIIHIGSTSIEGMSAKPIIDMDIVIDDWTPFPEIVQSLSRIGYRHIGDLGITGREVFDQDHIPVYSHHLYLCHINSLPYRNHVLLRKHLLENHEAFERYKKLKSELAKKCQNRDKYWRSKTELILEFLEKQGISKKELYTIRKQNS